MVVIAIFSDGPQGKDWIELGLLFVVMYIFLRFLRTTIAGGIFKGPAMLLWVILILGLVAIEHYQLETLGVVLAKALPIVALGLIVTFQTELRHGIARLGQVKWFRGLFGKSRGDERDHPAAREIEKSVTQFAKERIGALIAIERNIDLGTYIDSGVPMQAIIRAETLDTIFSTDTALHDGAVIIRNNRIASAGCVFPLTESVELARRYGTRHRAAVGLSEQSDAVVIVVSEERGHVHIAESGELTRYSDPSWLRAYLNVVFGEQGVS